MNTVNTEFSNVEVWFTDQSSNALEMNMAFYLLLESLEINMVKN